MLQALQLGHDQVVIIERWPLDTSGLLRQVSLYSAFKLRLDCTDKGIFAGLDLVTKFVGVGDQNYKCKT